MNKKYYYLEADRTNTRGPYTVAELAALLQQGTLTPLTEVAAKGDAAWRPLIQLLSEHPEAGNLPPVPPAAEDTDAPDAPPVPPVPPVPPQPAHCPDCYSELDPLALPVRCPGCQRLLRPERDTLWNNALMALRQYATLSGRATRKEFWDFVLFAYLFAFLFILGGGFALGWFLLSLPAGDTTLPLISLCAIAGIGALAWVALIIPTWCLLVRRLHDAGFSGHWVLLYLVVYVLYDVLAWFIYAPIFNGELLARFQSLESAGQAQELINNLNLQLTMVQSQGPGIWLQLASLVTSAMGFALFIMTLFDSQRGSNAYGPSRKYPLG